MGDVTSFREAKAQKECDAAQWTPVDCLKALLRDLESGELPAVDGIYVAMVRKNTQGNAGSLPYYAAGLTGLELQGMLLQHILNSSPPL